MKLLFINQFYWPDSSASSQQLTDLTEGLAARGHIVTVLCSEASYASSAGSTPPVDVTVIRVKSLPFVRGKLGRLLSYGSFYLSALGRGIFTRRVDAVITLTTPPLISLIGALIKMLRGSRHFCYEQDVYPDVAVDVETFARGGLLAQTVGLLADLPRRHSEGVIALGPCMKDRLVARGIPGAKVFVAENWANSSSITPLDRPGNLRELVLLYSGNLGLAHDLDTLTGAITRLKNDNRFRFLFVGSGGRKEELATFCTTNEIASVELRPYVPRDQLSKGLALGDIGLVTQHAVCCGSVIPSKFYGILASGRPVLFIGPAAATPALTIAEFRCGWQVEPGDVDGLTQLLQHLVANRELVREAGLNARETLVAHYDLPLGVSRFEWVLERESQPRLPERRKMDRSMAEVSKQAPSHPR